MCDTTISFIGTGALDELRHAFGDAFGRADERNPRGLHHVGRDRLRDRAPRLSTAAAVGSGVPARRLANAWRPDEARKRASASDLGGDDIDAEHQIRVRQLRRGFEPGAIDLDRVVQQGWREM